MQSCDPLKVQTVQVIQGVFLAFSVNIDLLEASVIMLVFSCDNAYVLLNIIQYRDVSNKIFFDKFFLTTYTCRKITKITA